MTDVERAEWSLCEWPWHAAADGARGYEIVGISGSSMGALVGGLQAADKLDQFADWARTLTQRAVLRLLDPAITAAGVLRADKILDAVRDILGEVTIEELSIPYTAVTTDLIAGKSVWLQRGPVDAAIRASIAIPGVIAPHVLDGRLLADGGILDPLPMAPIAAVNADLTIAVSLSGSEAGGRDEPTETDPRRTTEWLNRLFRSTSALLDTNAPRSLLDTPTARSMLSRFGTSPDPESDATSSRTIHPTFSSRCLAPPAAAWNSTAPPRSSTLGTSSPLGCSMSWTNPKHQFWKADSTAEEVGNHRGNTAALFASGQR